MKRCRLAALVFLVLPISLPLIEMNLAWWRAAVSHAHGEGWKTCWSFDPYWSWEPWFNMVWYHAGLLALALLTVGLAVDLLRK